MSARMNRAGATVSPDSHRPADHAVLAAAAVELSRPAPCTDCPHARRCAQGLACRAFALYADGHAAWRRAARKPSRAAFLRAFGTDG